MFERLKELEARYEEVQRRYSDPSFASDPEQLKELGKLNSELEETVLTFRKLKDALAQIESAKEILADDPDPEMATMAEN